MALFDFWKIRQACRVLQIVDRGERDPFWENGKCFTKTHAFCGTRLRIGIMEKNCQPVLYCWRCEQIMRFEYDYKDHNHMYKKPKPKKKLKKVSYLKIMK